MTRYTKKNKIIKRRKTNVHKRKSKSRKMNKGGNPCKDVLIGEKNSLIIKIKEISKKLKNENPSCDSAESPVSTLPEGWTMKPSELVNKYDLFNINAINEKNINKYLIKIKSEVVQKICQDDKTECEYNKKTGKITDNYISDEKIVNNMKAIIQKHITELESIKINCNNKCDKTTEIDKALDKLNEWKQMEWSSLIILTN